MKEYKMKSEKALMRKNRENVDAGLDMAPKPPAEMKLKSLDKPGTFDSSPDGARGDVPWGGQKSMVSAPRPTNVNVPVPSGVPAQLYDPAPPVMAVAPAAIPAPVPLLGQAPNPREQVMGLPPDLASIPMAPMSLVRNARKRRSIGV